MMLNGREVTKLLPKCLPHHPLGSHSVPWNPEDETHPSSDWIPIIWKYLQQHLVDLSSIEGIPLIPYQSHSSMFLLSLTYPSVLIMKEYCNFDLPEDLCDLLPKLGIYVLKTLPVEVQSHPAVLGRYVVLPLPEDLLDALMVISKKVGKQVFDTVHTWPEESRRTLRSFLSNVAASALDSEHIALLKKLPVFETLEGSGGVSSRFVSAVEVFKGTQGESLPVSVSQPLVNVALPDSAKLAKVIHMPILSVTMLLKTIVFRDVANGYYDSEKLYTLMSYILNHLALFMEEDNSFNLKSVPFIPSNDGCVSSPEDMFDPEVQILQDLFWQQDVFPGDLYCSSKTLSLLRKCGLKGTSDITANDILTAAHKLNGIGINEDNSVHVARKSLAILQILNTSSHHLHTKINGNALSQHLKSLHWLSCEKQKPEDYPCNLNWSGDANLYASSEIVELQNAKLVGSVKPCLPCKISDDVRRELGWTAHPSVDDIVCHIKNITQMYVPDEKPRFVSMLAYIYKHLAETDMGELSDALRFHSLDAWMWHGEGFSRPEQIILKNTFMDLRPYLFTLPTEVQKHQKFFLKFGIRPNCDNRMLTRVLFLIKIKHDDPDSVLTDDEVARDLQLSVDILNFLKPPDGEVADDEIRETLLMPTQFENGKRVKMLPLTDCTYCDATWIRQGYDLMDFSEDDGIVFIHSLVPTNTAECLGVPTLMSRMLKAEEFNITGFGQTEPLTTRLRQLTEEYTDGMSIPKELIQNADDAGATEVRFLYDERQNEDHLKYLLDEGMKNCQGPALWVYNNAEFSDQDFQNITKLGGATKDSDTSKIGRFGLGFNAVYNITDMPSFVSRSNIIIFDPHTTHLGKAIRDKPGIKIDMNKNKTLLRKLPDQFHPYENVFGCEISASAESNYFRGTLFRLPLRTRLEASKSKISSKSYEKKDMIELTQMMMKNLNTLLLFSQNVLTVSVYHLSADSSDPSQAHLLYQLKKQPVRILKRLEMDFTLSKTCASLPSDDQELIHNSSILKVVSKAMGEIKENKSRGHRYMPKQIKSSVLLNMHSEISPLAGSILDTNIGQADCFWLVVSEMGSPKAVDLALDHSQYIPTGAVALNMTKERDGFLPSPDIVNTGKVYCYMPLPLQSYLPVHINGHFAVTSNRRGLVEHTEDDKYNFKVEWNQMLLKDCISSAYCSLLNDVALLIPEDANVEFYQLWPDIMQVNRSFKDFACCVYGRILQNNSSPVVAVEGKVTNLDQLVLLDPSLNDKKMIAELLIELFDQFSKDQRMIELPKNIMDSIKANPSASFTINSKIIKKYRVFEEVIFPNLKDLDCVKRDVLILYALLEENGEFDDLLQSYQCIPVSSNGCSLRRPKDLVSPFGALAKLYDETDERFPNGTDSYLKRSVMVKLSKLGMAVNDIGWDDVLERVTTIHSVMKNDEKAGGDRLTAFLELLDRKLSNNSTVEENIQNVLINSAFLPILVKPEHFPLTWKGDEYQPNTLFSPVQLYLKRQRYLVGSQKPLIDERLFQNRELSLNLAQFLRLRNKEIHLKDVINQFNEVLKIDPKAINKDALQELQRTCIDIYAYFQREAFEDEKSKILIEEILLNQKWILIKDEFLDSKFVALQSSEDCSPFLYNVPEDLRNNFSPLLHIGGVQERFQTKDYVCALKSIHEETNAVPLNDRKLDVALKLTRLLNTSMKESTASQEQIEKQYGTIYIPDIRRVMQPASALCYNDCPWLSTSKHVNYTYPDVTYEMAVKMGVTTKRQQALKNYSTALPFGQKEKLTNSLKRILNSYPCDHEIFKELLQNADDAKATEIHFILDSRKHKDEHVFSKSWKPLQGPALCVYNNQPFSKSDLEGIQNIGEGSKSNDPNKTGQYGIGFSSVYHLTDVPSLITESDDLGKILCVFDPHCRYVPGATVSEPGMLYNNLDQLEGDFPDVFPCYLTSQYETYSNKTMFRFPLRSEQMAERSAISNKPISVEVVKRMMTRFRQEASEVLLFLNNIQKIVFKEIDSNGQMLQPYCIVSERSQTDQSVCSHFDNYTKGVAKEINKNLAITDILPMTVSYNLLVKDNAGLEQHWKIIQNIGGESKTEVPGTVKKAFAHGDLALLPRGGVACLIKSSRNGQLDYEVKPKKAFCFLPLPLDTGLPFHVNGHFALGFENRRQMWTDEDGTGYKDDWNQYLFSAVIAPCYIKMLLSLRSVCLKSSTKENTNFVESSSAEIAQAISNYNKNFPLFSESRPYWNFLVSAVYRIIASDEFSVLPVLQGFSTEVVSETEAKCSQWKVTWHPPGVDGSNPTYFNNLEDKSDASAKNSLVSNVYKGLRGLFKKEEKVVVKSEKDILKEVLLECGFLLLESPAILHESFLKAGVLVEYVSPEAVLAFFKSSQLGNTPCTLGTLPKELKTTPFRNIKTLTTLLKYCKCDPAFIDKLNGMPFLLTQDEVLRTFDFFSPVFLTSHNDLLIDCADVFVHKSLCENVFGDVSFDDSPVFQDFNVEALANLLDRKLSAKLYHSVQSHVEWIRKDPSEMWIRNLWIFLFRQCLKTNKYTPNDEDKEMTTEKVVSKLQLLNEWAILPSRKAFKPYLVPVKMASTIVDLTNCTYEQKAIRDVLKKLQIPELDRTVLFSGDVDLNDFVSMLVTTLSKAETVLSILHQTMTNANNAVKLTKEESERLLLYFNQNIDRLRNNPQNAELLRELPLFVTVCGDIISLSNCIVYTLPAKIPTDDMDIWQSKSGIVFLSRNESLHDLYEFLNCAIMSVVDVYCQFILQHFEYLSPKARYVHLHHLYKTYLVQSSSVGLSAEEKEGLLLMLKGLEFLPDKDGNLSTADCFYDPANHIFRIMFSEDKFPPRPEGLFRDHEWIDFLSMLGLKTIVDNDLCIHFAKRMANEESNPCSIDALTKSNALVQHLFERDCIGHDDFFKEMSEIKFLAPQKASDRLLSLSPQYGQSIANEDLSFFAFNNSVSVDYEDIVWTKAKLLPQWADPMKCRSINNEKRQQLMQYLKIQAQPSVDIVVSHLLELSNNQALPDSHFERSAYIETRLQVFKSVYRHLQNHGIKNPEVSEKLKEASCVLVENGMRLIKPTQTVFNLFDVDQIPPYLYKVPLELGEFQQFLLHVGSTDTSSGDQYANVLSQIHTAAGDDTLMPNELISSYKAVKGLLNVLEEDQEPDIPGPLYLPSEKGELLESSRLVFNDSPSYYDRIQTFKKPFLVNLKECGIQAVSFDNLVMKLPSRHRPQILSSLIRETLIDSCANSTYLGGIAAELKTRLTSEEFARGVIRLLRHEHHGSIQKDTQIMDAVDNLQLIQVFCVKNLTTHLICDGRPVKSSEIQKSCFVEKSPGSFSYVWNVYISDTAALSQDVLIKVADIVNKIVNDLLSTSVLYLLPILSCKLTDINSRLNALNIREDHSQPAQHSPSLPAVGSTIPIEKHHFLKNGQTHFSKGEYVGYFIPKSEDTWGEKYVYARVILMLYSSFGAPQCKVDIGNGTEPLVVNPSSLFKFQRH